MTEANVGEAPEAGTPAGAHQQLFEVVDEVPKSIRQKSNGHGRPLDVRFESPIASLAIVSM
jgi:hypothetical protein